MTFGQALMNLLVPAVVLAACFFVLPAVSELPASLAGLRVYGGWGMLALGAILALSFRRGRVVFVLITLALAYASYAVFVHDRLDSALACTVYAALCVFVPFDLALLCLLPERGTFNIHGLQRLGLLAAEGSGMPSNCVTCRSSQCRLRSYWWCAACSRAIRPW